MSLAERLKAAAAALVGGPKPRGPVAFAIPLPSFSARRGDRAVLEAYEEDGWFQSVVDTVANATATPRWRVLKPASPERARRLTDVRLALKSASYEVRTKALADAQRRGDLVELDQHELLRILENPHPEFTGRALRKLMQVHLDLPGETFLWLQRDAGGRVVGMLVLPPHCVQTTPTEGSPFFLVSYNLTVVQVPQGDMVWLKHLSPRNPHGRGVGRGKAMGEKLDASSAIDTATKAAFERGGIPAAVAGVDSKSDDVDVDEAIKDLQKRYEASFQSPENAGKVWFVPGGVSLAQVQVNFRELQMQEMDKALRDFVRQCFNVPPELVGDLTSSNRSTSEEAKYILAEYAVLPRLEFLRSELQHKLVPLVDADAILEFEDPRPQSWERTFKVLTTPPAKHVGLNEYRVFGGLPPLDELDGQFGEGLPGAGGGNNVASAQANASPAAPPRPDTRGGGEE